MTDKPKVRKPATHIQIPMAPDVIARIQEMAEVEMRTTAQQARFLFEKHVRPAIMDTPE